MTKKKEEHDVILDVQEVYSKSEHFIENNKKPIGIVLGAVVLIIATFIFYFKIYLPPIQSEAQADMFWAEKYFEKDSLNQAINGDNLHDGFINIAENYSGTKAGNLAHYYLGICYRNTGKYEDAISELKKFSSSDIMISSIALGAIADSYVELNDFDNAISYYNKAAENQANQLTTPTYLFKLGLAYEQKGDYNKASESYQKIKDDYPDSREGRTIEKYIARANGYKK